VLQGDCEEDAPKYNEEPKQVNRKDRQCVLTTKLRLFEWSSGDQFNVWIHNLAVRHVPSDQYKNIDLLYWNMKRGADPMSNPQESDPYIPDTHLWMTRVHVVSTGQKPQLEPQYQTVEKSVTGIYAEGGLALLHGVPSAALL
jgi:hypothetical protein